MKKNVYEKIYAGLIGMDAGMRLGAPVENIYWTYDRLREQLPVLTAEGIYRVLEQQPPSYEFQLNYHRFFLRDDHKFWMREEEEQEGQGSS